MAVFTTEARLENKNCRELIAYWRDYAWDYHIAERYTWRRILESGGLTENETNILNQNIQTRFRLLKRTANSITRNMKGRYKALVELKNLELTQLDGKIEATSEKIAKLKKWVDAQAKLAACNALDETALAKYRGKKRSLFYQHQKLQKLKDRRARLYNDIEAGNYKMAFGGKNAFRAQYHLEENGFRSHEEWYLWYIQKRDSNIFYLGSSDESLSNQMFHLTPMPDKKHFAIHVRKDGKYAPSKRRGDPVNYEEGMCEFRYMSEDLFDALMDSHLAVSYRIKLRGKKVYLQAIMDIPAKQYPVVTTMYDGAIGLDFNDGHIDLAETDRHGNLVKLKTFYLKYHGAGKKAQNEMRQTVAEIGHYALSVGKSIVKENLSFVRKKSRATKAKSSKGKKYNRMIHALDYSRYHTCLKNMSFRFGIDLVLVNPAYTSKIAKQKYCKDRKLPIHHGAAYVIARRGQGFHDTYCKRKAKAA